MKYTIVNGAGPLPYHLVNELGVVVATYRTERQAQRASLG